MTFEDIRARAVRATAASLVSAPEDVNVRMEPVGASGLAAAAAEPLATASKDPADGLDAFAAESPSAAASKVRPRWRGRAMAVTLAAGAACVAFGIGLSLASARWSSSAARDAVLAIETDPSGLDVTIDGVSRGRTPLTLRLPPRTYEAIVGSGAGQRIVKATLAPGATVVQRLEISSVPLRAGAAGGILRIETEPSGRAIQVDGVERGVSPLTLADLPLGNHEVVALNGREPIARRVTLRRGETTSLLLSAPRPAEPAVAAGWISVTAPVALQMREDGKLLGSTESERVMVAAGAHTIDLVNEPLGFTLRRTLNVASGKVASLRVDVPNGSLSVNAQPWAEVWVDGTRIGETPIGNLARPIGRHEVVFRHPQLGERREIVTVTMLQPTRLGVDLRQKTP